MRGMASVKFCTSDVRRPALTTTYEGGDPALLRGVLPHVAYIEITPDAIAEMEDNRARLNPEVVAELKDIAPEVRLIVHGVGLSIGSNDGYSESYIRLLDQLFSEFDIAWHSEHLAYTTVDGENLGTML